MKILLVARFNNTRHVQAALYQRALERLGASVTPFNLEHTGWLDRLTRKDLTVRLEQAIQHAAPDLVLVTDGEVLRDGAVEPLRARSTARWVHWFAEQESGEATMPKATRACDLVFVAGALKARHWAESGGVPVRALDAGCDPSVHRPLRVREPFRANVVFVGSATHYREAVLTQLMDFGLAVWGPGWKRTALKEYCRGEQLSLENYVRAYAGATIAVNIHRKPEGPVPDGAVNARLFEIAAIGVPQATEPRRELASHFEPGKEVLTYHNVEELREKVRHALADGAIRQTLALGARQTALRRHTYMHRMRELLDAVGGL